jgi:hypothetical protein
MVVDHQPGTVVVVHLHTPGTRATEHQHGVLRGIQIQEQVNSTMVALVALEADTMLGTTNQILVRDQAVSRRHLLLVATG